MRKPTQIYRGRLLSALFSISLRAGARKSVRVRISPFAPRLSGGVPCTPASSLHSAPDSPLAPFRPRFAPQIQAKAVHRLVHRSAPREGGSAEREGDHHIALEVLDRRRAWQARNLTMETDPRWRVSAASAAAEEVQSRAAPAEVPAELNPWRTIWFSPRVTVRYLIDAREPPS